MHLAVLFSIFLAVSASAFPRRRSSELDLRNNAGMIRAAGNNKNNNNNDPQTSLTLDPKVIADGFKNNGQQGNATPGQVASLTSSNNFINFCLTVPNKPITNGQQVLTGSCNPAPMGVIAAKTNMPSSKFVNPTNFDTIKANTAFDIKMAITHLQAGNFVNAESNYYSAPQQVNNAGDIIGHSHFVVQKVDSFKSTKVLDPTVFAFFKGVNTAADQAGNLAVTVDGGLPEGLYRLASINTSANHTPALVAVAQHGSLDDQVYFAVTADGKPPAGSTPNPQDNNTPPKKVQNPNPNPKGQDQKGKNRKAQDKKAGSQKGQN